MLERWYGISLMILTCLHLGLAAVLPPLDDEIYYWCWAQELQLSYFDHPPATAYFIRASTSLLGDSVFAIRLPACLATLSVLVVLGHLTRPSHLLAWVILTPLFTYGGFLITPDTPLLLFWSLYLLWLVKVHQHLGELRRTVHWSMWVLGGVLLGLGLLGKYTMALAVPAAFFSFLSCRRSWQNWLPGFVAHGLIACILMLPILIFNLRHDFAPIRFQWSHAMASCTRPWFVTASEFAGVQMLLFGTMPLFLLPWVFSRFPTLARDPVLRVSASLFMIPFAFFLYKSTRGPLEGNWALASYLGFWPVAAYWYEQYRERKLWRWAVAASFILPIAAVVALSVHLIHPIELMKPKADRISRLSVRMEIAKQAAEESLAQGLPIYTPTYQWTALLRYYGADARQMDHVSRPSHFTTGRSDQLSDVDQALVFNEALLPKPLTDGFGEPVLVAQYPMIVRGEVVSGFSLLKYTKCGTPCPEKESENPDSKQSHGLTRPTTVRSMTISVP